VNLAVRSAGIMTGYPSGTFGPDDLVTYGQAVTVLMRALGYTSADVGTIWPDDYIAKAEEIGLTDGLSLSGDAELTRAQAAVLFANFLSTETNGSNNSYVSTISGLSLVENVFLVSGDATTDDGTEGAVKVAGAVTGTYLPVNDVPDDLVGLFGTLVLNSAGKALTFLPEDSGTTVVSTVSATSASTIPCTNGTKISMSSPSFYLAGTLTDYSDCWYDIGSGMSVSAYYTDGGTVKYVLVTTVDSTYDSVTVMTGSYVLSSYTAIYKNGSAVTSSDLEKYDVLTYDTGSGVYYASDTRVTGIWEDAEPNDETPSTITLLGAEFDVLESAASSLSDFEIGDSVTLLLTVDNKVAYAVRPSSLSAANIGYVANATSGGATIELLSGITVSGRLESDAADDYEGLLVRVTSSEAGYVTLSELSDLSVTSALDLTDVTLGDYGSPAMSASLNASAAAKSRKSISAISSWIPSPLRTSNITRSTPPEM
jgi:hypothetical protein